MIRLLNQTYLERDSRFQVAASFSAGRSALRWLLSHPADLAVLDIYMPELTGLELLQRLRAQGVALDTILVTAANDGKTVDACLKLGAVDYLVKPFTAQRFHQALDTFCRHRQALAAGSVSQETLDRLLGQPAPDAEPPKGLQPETLLRIRACLASAPAAGMTCEDLARQSALSVVTVRRYVNYLTETGQLLRTTNYDTGGRPCHLYRFPDR